MFSFKTKKTKMLTLSSQHNNMLKEKEVLLERQYYPEDYSIDRYQYMRECIKLSVLTSLSYDWVMRIATTKLELLHTLSNRDFIIGLSTHDSYLRNTKVFKEYFKLYSLSYPEFEEPECMSTWVKEALRRLNNNIIASPNDFRYRSEIDILYLTLSAHINDQDVLKKVLLLAEEKPYSEEKPSFIRRHRL